MGSRFYNISRDEMHQHLTSLGFQAMKLPNCVELVYGKIVHLEGHRLSLRIYTAINPNGESREIGSDAIRLRLYFLVNDEAKPVGRPFRCLRVKNWRENIANAVDGITADFKVCGTCGNPMALREGQNGEFWGCVMYHSTGCKGKPKEAPRQTPTALPTRQELSERAKERANRTPPKGPQKKLLHPPVPSEDDSDLAPWEIDDRNERSNRTPS